MKSGRLIRGTFVGLLVMLGVFLLPQDASKCRESYQKDRIIHIVGKSDILNAQLSDSEIERELGLGGKECIGTSQAMLFSFDAPGYYGIWMKGMKFPIDIVWVNEVKTVTHVESGVAPESYPTIYTPNNLSKYVIELQSGAVESLNLRPGTQLDW